MIALAMVAPIRQLLVFGNGKGFFDEFDLLSCFWFYFGEVELLSAVGTFGEFEFDNFIDQFGSDGFAEVLFVTGSSRGLLLRDSRRSVLADFPHTAPRNID